VITGFSHIGFAAENMGKALQAYRQLFDLDVAHVFKDGTTGNVISLLPIGDNVIVVVEPSRIDGFAGKYIKKNGEGLYYYSLVSNNLPEEIASLKQNGIALAEFEPTVELPFKAVWFEMYGAVIKLISEDMQRWIWQKCAWGKGRVRISHVGHAIRNTKIAENTYEDVLGLRRSFYLNLKDAGLLSTMIPVGQNFVELLEPTDEKGPIRKFLNNRGEGLYHICLVVKDVDDEISILKSRGVKVIEIPPTEDLPYKTAWFRLNGVSYELLNEVLLSYLQKTGKK
jgi:methylmalonyl-CoA/ethylmalonyl-CoA epimerase